MKTIKTRLNSLLTATCSAILSLLGFSCSSDTPLMYGMPTGDFEVKGAVSDDSGNPVSNAEIRVTYPEVPSGIYRFGETSTDSKGNYKIEGKDYLSDIKVVCIPDNVDLQPDSIIIRMVYKDPDKHNSWDYGTAKETVNFTLKNSN